MTKFTLNIFLIACAFACVIGANITGQALGEQWQEEQRVDSAVKAIHAAARRLDSTAKRDNPKPFATWERDRLLATGD